MSFSTQDPYSTQYTLESLSPLPLTKEILLSEEGQYSHGDIYNAHKYTTYPLLMAAPQDNTNYSYMSSTLTYPTQSTSQWVGGDYNLTIETDPWNFNNYDSATIYSSPSTGGITIPVGGYPSSADSFTTGFPGHLSPASPFPPSPHSLSPTNTGLSLTPSPAMGVSSDRVLPPLDSPSETVPADYTSSNRQGYSHKDAVRLFREVLSFPAGSYGPFVPQDIYRPHTTSDRKRYVEDINLEAPIYFQLQANVKSNICGIPLSDALHSRTRDLVDSSRPVFEGRGPSVSIRLEWPGYRRWSRQIPTKDFRSPPQPITVAKLAKNVAKCVKRFLEAPGSIIDEDPETVSRWKVSQPGGIQLEDLILVSIHHTSLGSWQPQIRLRQPHQNSGVVRPTAAMLQAAHARAHAHRPNPKAQLLHRPAF